MGINYLERLQAARFEIVELTHEGWEWVAVICKDGITTKGIHPKKQGCLEEAYRAWKVQSALQTIPGEPPTLGVKARDGVGHKERVG